MLANKTSNQAALLKSRYSNTQIDYENSKEFGCFPKIYDIGFMTPGYVGSEKYF